MLMSVNVSQTVAAYSSWGLINVLLQVSLVLRTGRQISAKKSSRIIGLFSHRVHICIPRKIVADQDSQVPCILGVSEFFAMDGVVGINRFPLLNHICHG